MSDQDITEYDETEEVFFSGVQLYKRPDGTLACNLFQNGMITPLEPNEQDRTRPLGFYDFDMNPVPEPTEATNPQTPP